MRVKVELRAQDQRGHQLLGEIVAVQIWSCYCCRSHIYYNMVLFFSLWWTDIGLFPTAGVPSALLASTTATKAARTTAAATSVNSSS